MSSSISSGPSRYGHGQSVGSKWERLAVLTEEQQAAVAALGAACSQRPVPDVVLAREAEGREPAAPPTPSSPSWPASPRAGVDAAAPAPARDVVLQHSSDFYAWLSELEAARGRETAARFGTYQAELAGHLAACAGVLESCEALAAACAALGAGHAGVSAAGAPLAARCEALEAQRSAREALASALRARLARFDDLERLGLEAASAAASPDPAGLLARLDDALAFLAAHPHWAGAAAAAARLRQLQARTLSALRARVAGALRAASAAAVAERAARSGGVEGAGGGRAAASRRASASEEAAAGAGAAEGAVASDAPGGTSIAGASPPDAPDDAPAESVPASAASPSPSTDEGVEALAAVRFRAVAEPALGPLLAGVEARAGSRPEYARLLSDCQGSYCGARLVVLAPVVYAALARGAGLPPGEQIAAADVLLRRLCREEAALFRRFFPASAQRDALGRLVEPLAQRAYDALRPRVVAEQALDALCAAADAAAAAAAETRGGGAAPADELVAPTFRRVLADVRERLTFRAQAFIRERVAGHAAVPTDFDGYYSLDGRGQGGVARAVQGGDAAAGSAMRADGASESVGPGGVAKGDGDPPTDSSTPPAGPPAARQYPPVTATLALLGQLAPRLDARIFAGLAHEALAAATLAVLAGSRAVAKLPGCTPLQAQLFGVSQLLALREGAARHPTTFAVVQRDLDFSHTRETLRRAASGQLPLFTLSSSNAVLQLMSRGAPRLLESRFDAKKELERELKFSCESFIMSVTKLVVEPALSFMSKAAAAGKVPAAPAGGSGADKEAAVGSKPLHQLAFASPERVAELSQRLRGALAGVLPEAATALRASLPDGGSRSALAGPIAGNVAEALGQLEDLLAREFPEGTLDPTSVLTRDEVAAALRVLG
ncbi:COG3 [Auxenochlorella protothecoides x Auxenochlorella symbiontica]